MKKYFVFPLTVFALLFLLALASIAEPRAFRTTNDSYNILVLSDREVFIPCKLGYVPTESCPDRKSITIAVRGNKNPETDEESAIGHTVSGGRFVRKGEYYEWDFSGVEKPGVYTLTVEFIDFNGKKQSSTETITLRECDCPNDDYLANSASPSPTPTPSAKAEKIELDRREIVIPCAPGIRPRDASVCGDEAKTIQVKTSIANPQNEELMYHYTVSGGQILGSGANVTWDLSGVRPGTYTIKATIGNSTTTETITVRECDCGGDCFCPTISATGNQNSRNPETFVFEADLTGGTGSSITYNWTVSQGEIIAGQGTPAITVKIDDKLKGAVKATVEIGGVCEDCLKTASATVKIVK